MNMTTRDAIIKAQLAAYLAADRKEKGRILDAISRTTAMSRKAAMRRLRTLQLRRADWQDRRGGKVEYGPAVAAALREIWELQGRICAERMHHSIPEAVRVLARDKMWHHDAETTALLLRMSLGTLKDRIGRFPRVKKGGGRSATKPSGLKELIPIRRGPWENPPPGKGEIDTVAHCGMTLAGDFVYTVQYTDVATIWTLLSAQWQKGEEATVASIEAMASRLPFPLLGLDPDSGSEFVNWHLKKWCDARGIDMTRIRPGEKNDHARIEQKNYANVRHVVGYGRFDDPGQVGILNALYLALEDYLNFFIPSMKCVEKIREGGKTKRKYDPAQTAYQRVLAHPLVGKEVKQELRRKYATLNPKVLRSQIDALLKRLGGPKQP